MDEPVLRIERADAVATVTLSRPDAMNALSLALRQALASGFSELAADPEIRVIVLTGAGRAFCAGWDLKELAGRGSNPDTSKKADTNGTAAAIGGEATDEMQAAIDGFPGPIIGAVNGHAITGGFELALACDVLIASTAARFADTHARVGILPGWGLSQKLPRLIGIGRAKEISFAGNFIDAETALRWGLVNRVVAPDELLPTAQALARDMASCVPEVLAGYKRLIDRGSRMTLSDALRMEKTEATESARAMTKQQLDTRRTDVQDRGREQQASLGDDS